MIPELDEERLQAFFEGADKPKDTAEVLAWCREAADRQVRGTRDNDVWNDRGELVETKDALRRELLLKGKGHLICHCRYISAVMAELFSEAGIPARLTEWIAVEKLEDGWRHTTLEFFMDGRWVFVDLNVGMFYTDGERPLSALDIKEGYDEDELTPDSVALLVERKEVDASVPRMVALNKFIGKPDRIHKHMARKLQAIMYRPKVYARPYDEATVRENSVDSFRKEMEFVERDAFIEKHY